MLHIIPLFVYIILPITIIYILVSLIYKYILHPDYRWDQKNNICYDYKRDFSIILSLAIYVITLLFYFQLLII